MPKDLSPLVAGLLEHSGGNSSFARALRARMQLRGKDGKFIPEGGAASFSFRRPDGSVVNSVGVFVGMTNNPKMGEFYVSKDANGLKDGFYSINGDDATAIKPTPTTPGAPAAPPTPPKVSDPGLISSQGLTTDIPNQDAIPYSNAPLGWKASGTDSQTGNPTSWTTDDGKFTVTSAPFPLQQKTGNNFTLTESGKPAGAFPDWAATLTSVSKLDKNDPNVQPPQNHVLNSDGTVTPSTSPDAKPEPSPADAKHQDDLNPNGPNDTAEARALAAIKPYDSDGSIAKMIDNGSSPQDILNALDNNPQWKSQHASYLQRTSNTAPTTENQQAWDNTQRELDAINGLNNKTDVTKPDTSTGNNLDLSVGDVAAEGYLVPTKGNLENHDIADFTGDQGGKIVADYISTHKDELSQKGKRLSVTWDADNKQVSLDIVDQVADHNSAQVLASQREETDIYDVANSKAISTSNGKMDPNASGIPGAPNTGADANTPDANAPTPKDTNTEPSNGNNTTPDSNAKQPESDESGTNPNVDSTNGVSDSGSKSDEPAGSDDTSKSGSEASKPSANTGNKPDASTEPDASGSSTESNSGSSSSSGSTEPDNKPKLDEEPEEKKEPTALQDNKKPIINPTDDLPDDPKALQRMATRLEARAAQLQDGPQAEAIGKQLDAVYAKIDKVTGANEKPPTTPEDKNAPAPEAHEAPVAGEGEAPRIDDGSGSTGKSEDAEAEKPENAEASKDNGPEASKPVAQITTDTPTTAQGHAQRVKSAESGVQSAKKALAAHEKTYGSKNIPAHSASKPEHLRRQANVKQAENNLAKARSDQNAHTAARAQSLIDNAETMHGTGSKEHKEAQKRFGPAAKSAPAPAKSAEPEAPKEEKSDATAVSTPAPSPEANAEGPGSGSESEGTPTDAEAPVKPDAEAPATATKPEEPAKTAPEPARVAVGDHVSWTGVGGREVTGTVLRPYPQTPGSVVVKLDNPRRGDPANIAIPESKLTSTKPDPNDMSPDIKNAQKDVVVAQRRLDAAKLTGDQSKISAAQTDLQNAQDEVESLQRIQSRRSSAAPTKPASAPEPTAPAENRAPEPDRVENLDQPDPGVPANIAPRGQTPITPDNADRAPEPSRVDNLDQPEPPTPDNIEPRQALTPNDTLPEAAPAAPEEEEPENGNPETTPEVPETAPSNQEQTEPESNTAPEPEVQAPVEPDANPPVQLTDLGPADESDSVLKTEDGVTQGTVSTNTANSYDAYYHPGQPDEQKASFTNKQDAQAWLGDKIAGDTGSNVNPITNQPVGQAPADTVTYQGNDLKPVSAGKLNAIDAYMESKNIDPQRKAELQAIADKDGLVQGEANRILKEIQAAPNNPITRSKPRDPDTNPANFTKLAPALTGLPNGQVADPNLVMQDIFNNHPGAQKLPNGDVIVESHTVNGKTYDVIVRRTGKERFFTYLRETDTNTGNSRVSRMQGRETHSYKALANQMNYAKVFSRRQDADKRFAKRKNIENLPDAPGSNIADLPDPSGDLIDGTDIPRTSNGITNKMSQVISNLVQRGETRKVIDFFATKHNLSPSFVDNIVQAVNRKRALDGQLAITGGDGSEVKSHVPFGGGDPLTPGEWIDWTDTTPTFNIGKPNETANPNYGRVYRGRVVSLRYKTLAGKYIYSDSAYVALPEKNREAGLRNPESHARSLVTSGLKRVSGPNAAPSAPFFPKALEAANQENVVAPNKPIVSADFHVPANPIEGQNLPQMRPRGLQAQQIDPKTDIFGHRYLGDDDAPVDMPDTAIGMLKQAHAAAMSTPASGLKPGDVISLRTQGEDRISKVISTEQNPDGTLTANVAFYDENNQLFSKGVIFTADHKLQIVRDPIGPGGITLAAPEPNAPEVRHAVGDRVQVDDAPAWEGTVTAVSAPGANGEVTYTIQNSEGKSFARQARWVGAPAQTNQQPIQPIGPDGPGNAPASQDNKDYLRLRIANKQLTAKARKEMFADLNRDDFSQSDFEDMNRELNDHKNVPIKLPTAGSDAQPAIDAVSAIAGDLNKDPHAAVDGGHLQDGANAAAQALADSETDEPDPEYGAFNVRRISFSQVKTTGTRPGFSEMTITGEQIQTGDLIPIDQIDFGPGGDSKYYIQIQYVDPNGYMSGQIISSDPTIDGQPENFRPSPFDDRGILRPTANAPKGYFKTNPKPNNQTSQSYQDRADAMISKFNSGWTAKKQGLGGTMNGDTAKLVETNDGTVLFTKTVEDRQDFYAEIAASKILNAMGLNSTVVTGLPDERTIVSDPGTGKLGFDSFYAYDPREDIANKPGAKLTGLLDYVIVNSDRNSGNYFISSESKDGDVIPIDHGLASFEEGYYARTFAAPALGVLQGGFSKPVFTKAELIQLKANVKELEGDFATGTNPYGKEWMNFVLGRFDNLIDSYDEKVKPE